jgi:hypothetical protein
MAAIVGPKAALVKVAIRPVVPRARRPGPGAWHPVREEGGQIMHCYAHA